MPKKFIILILIFIGSSNALPVFASTVKDGVEYWSTSEMLELKKRIRAEEESCNSDAACEINVREFYNENFPDKYKAFTIAEAEFCNFGIAAFNPAAETIKIVFNDKEECTAWGKDAVAGKLMELYVVWSEDGPNGEFCDIDYDGARIEPYYVTDINNNNLREGLHLITKQIDTVSGLTWLTPLEEIEISVAGSDLAANTSGRYYYSTFREPRFTAFGFRAYTDCLESPDYQEGMECRLMFGSDYSFSYMPFSVGSPTETVTQVQKMASEVPEVAEPQTPVISTSTIRVPDTPVEATFTTISTPVEPNPDTQIEVPLAAKNREETHEFPWWFIVFIFSGIFLILWWFIPLSKRKKSKKTLDKTDQIE